MRSSKVNKQTAILNCGAISIVDGLNCMGWVTGSLGGVREV